MKVLIFLPLKYIAHYTDVSELHCVKKSYGKVTMTFTIAEKLGQVTQRGIYDKSKRDRITPTSSFVNVSHVGGINNISRNVFYCYILWGNILQQRGLVRIPFRRGRESYLV